MMTTTTQDSFWADAVDEWSDSPATRSAKTVVLANARAPRATKDEPLAALLARGSW